MRKNIILLILFPCIVFGFGSLIEKQIDTITAPSGNLTLKNSVIIDSGTATTVPYLDASKVITSSTVTPTQLEFLNTTTQDIQVALDNLDANLITASQELQNDIDTKVSLTATQTVLGDKTFGGDTEFSNTGAVLLSRGLTGERPTGANGHLRYNTTDDSFEGFAGGAWGPIGGSVDLSIVTQDIIPDTDIAYDIGSLTKRWASVFGETVSVDLIEARQQTTPATPISGNLLYFKSDDNLYKLDSAGNELQVGALLDLGAITQSVIPDTDVAYDLGASSLKFSDAWIETVTINELQSDGKIEVSSTTQSSIPCPVMTKVQMEAIVTPTNGSCVFNSDDNAQFNYDSVLTEWVISGSVVNVENITDWVSYVPVFQGYGTPTSVDVKWRRVGSDIELKGEFTTGTTTAVEAQIGLPSGETIELPDASSTQLIGLGYRADTSNAVHTLLGTNGDAFINLSRADATLNNLTPQNANGLIGSSTRFSFFAKVRIQGWESSTKYATSSCEGLACFNEFSARVANNGTASVTSENLDFIDTVTRSALGIVDVVYKAGIFTETPSVTGSGNSDPDLDFVAVSSTASGFTARTKIPSGAAFDRGFDFRVQRQGADFAAFDKRFISINDVENVFSARIEAATSLNSKNADWLDTTTPINNTGVGLFTINYKTGHFSVLPALSSSANESGGFGNYNVEFSNETLNSVDVRVYNTGSSAPENRDISVVAQRQGSDYKEPKAYVGNLNPSGFVRTVGVSEPKMYSAEIANAGTISNESGSFINGNCTNAHPNVCTFEVGAFTGTPKCVTNSTSNHLNYCIVIPTATTASVYCSTASTGGTTTTSTAKTLICHGE